jgi:hypothetical protein
MDFTCKYAFTCTIQYTIMQVRGIIVSIRTCAMFVNLNKRTNSELESAARFVRVV